MNEYYDVIDAMEKANVDPEYISGWACGYLHNPTRGPQHVTEAYEAGYADGHEHKANGYQAWLKVA